MSITITNGSDSITPLMSLSHESESKSGNIVHELLDGNISISFRPLRPSKGTHEFLFSTEAEANAAKILHSKTGTFVLSDTDLPTMSMSYVIAAGGKVVRKLDKDTRKRWIVSVDYQEVLT